MTIIQSIGEHKEATTFQIRKRRYPEGRCWDLKQYAIDPSTDRIPASYQLLRIVDITCGMAHNLFKVQNVRTKSLFNYWWYLPTNSFNWMMFIKKISSSSDPETQLFFYNIS
jgi:hypothetical protein